MAGDVSLCGSRRTSRSLRTAPIAPGRCAAACRHRTCAGTFRTWCAPGQVGADATRDAAGAFSHQTTANRNQHQTVARRCILANEVPVCVDANDINRGAHIQVEITV